MKQLIKVLSSILLISLLCACGVPGQGNSPESADDVVNTKVAATFAALTQAVQPTPSFTGQPAASEAQVTLTPSPTLNLTSTLTPEVSPTLTITPIPEPGTIAGAISGYPYGNIPSLVVVAAQQETSGNYSYVITSPGETYYSIGNAYVLPGQWRVYAYDSSGHSGGCTAVVTVKSEETVTCDITDWSGSYPAKPADIPNP